MPHTCVPRDQLIQPWNSHISIASQHPQIYHLPNMFSFFFSDHQQKKFKQCNDNLNDPNTIERRKIIVLPKN